MKGYAYLEVDELTIDINLFINMFAILNLMIISLEILNINAFHISSITEKSFIRGTSSRSLSL